MDQALTGQMEFPILQEADKPQMLSIEKLGEIDTELDAINYSIDLYAKRCGYSCTQKNLAAELGFTKQILTKLRQGDCGMPRGSFMRFIEVTKSYTLLQFYAKRLGLVLKTHKQQQEDNREVEMLRERNAILESRIADYKRAVGE